MCMASIPGAGTRVRSAPCRPMAHWWGPCSRPRPRPSSPARRRRRAKALNQVVTGAAQQTTALARATARLLRGTVLLPVTATVKGGRRAGQRPGDPQGDQPGCPAGSAWPPQKGTGRNPGPGRRRGRRVCARGQGRPTALSGDHRVGQAVDPHRSRQQRWAAKHRSAGNANGDAALTNPDAACGSVPDASRANRPARRGRFGC